MKRHFSYSVLQYKHSLVLGEALNVGILFYFPEENMLEFVFANGHRAKSIYPDFDPVLFNSLIQTLKRKLTKQGKLLLSADLNEGLKSYIQTFILGENASALQFSVPVLTLSTFPTIQETIRFYSNQLLPGIITEKPAVMRYNEHLIIKEYVGYVFEKHQDLEKKIKRNEEITEKGLSWKFDVAWRYNSFNLVKPVSFDLSDEQSIQTKATTVHGLLSVLGSYGKKNNCRFDLLLAIPKNPRLFRLYDNAVSIIDSAKAPKRLITQDKWPAYYQETIDALLS